MKSFTVCVLLAGLAGLPVCLYAQETDLQKQMQEYMQKYASPGEHHKHLAMLAGRWNTVTKFWPAPGAPATESPGTAEHKMLLGGRYLQTTYQGSFMGMDFRGMGIAGYDNFKQKYVESWIDSMGTMVMISEGTCDGTGKTRTVTAQFDDPMTGKPTTMRSVYRISDADHYTLDMYSKVPDGKEFLSFQIVHTRAK
jgi:hypothetical protein